MAAVFALFSDGGGGDLMPGSSSQLSRNHQKLLEVEMNSASSNSDSPSLMLLLSLEEWGAHLAMIAVVGASLFLTSSLSLWYFWRTAVAHRRGELVGDDDESHQGIMNCYLISLSMADFFTSVVIVPFSLYTSLNDEWSTYETGPLLCKFTAYLQIVLLAASIYTIAWISVDRYGAFMKPSRYEVEHSLTRCKCWVAFSWLTALLLASPILMAKMEVNYSPLLHLCLLDWSSSTLAYSSTLGFLVAIPSLCTVIFTLTAILFTMSRPDEYDDLQRAAIQTDRNFPIAAFIIITFIISWTPILIAHIVTLMEYGAETMGELMRLKFWLLWTALGCNASKMLIYLFFNKHFRQGLCATVACLCYPCLAFFGSSSGRTSSPYTDHGHRRRTGQKETWLKKLCCCGFCCCSCAPPETPQQQNSPYGNSSSNSIDATKKGSKKGQNFARNFVSGSPEERGENPGEEGDGIMEEEEEEYGEADGGGGVVITELPGGYSSSVRSENTELMHSRYSNRQINAVGSTSRKMEVVIEETERHAGTVSAPPPKEGILTENDYFLQYQQQQHHQEGYSSYHQRHLPPLKKISRSGGTGRGAPLSTSSLPIGGAIPSRAVTIDDSTSRRHHQNQNQNQREPKRYQTQRQFSHQSGGGDYYHFQPNPQSQKSSLEEGPEHYYDQVNTSSYHSTKKFTKMNSAGEAPPENLDDSGAPLMRHGLLQPKSKSTTKKKKVSHASSAALMANYGSFGVNQNNNNINRHARTVSAPPPPPKEGILTENDYFLQYQQQHQEVHSSHHHRHHLPPLKKISRGNRAPLSTSSLPLSISRGGGIPLGLLSSNMLKNRKLGNIRYS